MKRILILVLATLASVFAFMPVAHAAAPTITSLTPNQGPPATPVRITGTNFGPIVTAVKFGNTTTSFTTDSPTQITAYAPAGSGVVDVTVTTGDGTSNAMQFTYGATTPPPPPPGKVSFGPGDSITSDGGPPAGSWCTVAAVGYDDLNNLVAITAGHCTTRPNQHQEVFLSGKTDIGAIGTYETINTIWPGFPSTQFPANSSKDYAVIKLDTNKITPRNTTPNGTLINAIGPAPVPWRDIMCKYGQVSLTTCGLVMNYENTTIRSWATIIPGDSGGPVTIDGKWVGLNSAVNPLVAPPFQFTGVEGILADIASQGPNTIGIGFEPLA